MAEGIALPERTPEPKVAGSSPAGDVREVQSEKKLTASKRTDSVSKDAELVSGLFSEREIDPELRTVIDRWPELAPELRAAILKIAEK